MSSPAFASSPVLEFRDVTFRRDGNEIIRGVSLHHLEELPSATTHALLIADGRVVAAGPALAALSSENVSQAFAHPIDVRHEDGRWTARAARRSRDLSLR